MKEEDIKKLNIYEKMMLITEEIGVVEKELEVKVTKTSSYKAVSERKVLDAVKPIERKYRMYSYPIKREVIDKDILVKESEYEDYKTGEIKTSKTNTLFMRINTTYRFVNVDSPDEFIETNVYGDGLDTGDKAPGKAMTYADKYALMKAYKLSTGDDPDKDPSPEKGYKKAVTTDFKKIIENYITKNNIDKVTFCTKYKLNAKSTNADFKKVYEELEVK